MRRGQIPQFRQIRELSRAWLGDKLQAAVQGAHMSKSKGSVGRRGFLAGAAASVAGMAGATKVLAQQEQRPAAAEARGSIEVTGTEKPGSDFMVDVLRTLGMEYCAANPGSSFRGLQESIINYGGNRSPEWLTCCHEESSVAMAHGYAKIEGKPMMVM